jgi:uracil-DNA glycosylase
MARMTATLDNPDRLSALLAWYREMGVTAALDTEPVDWRARGDKAPGAGFNLPERAPQAVQRAAASIAAPSTASPPWDTSGSIPPARIQPPAARSPAGVRPEPQRPAPARPQPVPAVRAFDAAPGAPPPPVRVPVTAGSLAELAAALAAFDGCGLKGTAKNLCLYRGAQTAPVMIIGEAPGREEDIAGKPFVGPAGQLLDRMLAAIAMTESDVHITNVVYWRPPGNRTPTDQEVLACAPFLARQIELVQPKAVLLLGGAAAKQILATADGIMKLRGKWRDLEIGGRTIPVLPTLHPAYVLRTPASKRQVWRDLLALKSILARN